MESLVPQAVSSEYGERLFRSDDSLVKAVKADPVAAATSFALKGSMAQRLPMKPLSRASGYLQGRGWS